MLPVLRHWSLLGGPRATLDNDAEWQRDYRAPHDHWQEPRGAFSVPILAESAARSPTHSATLLFLVYQSAIYGGTGFLKEVTPHFSIFDTSQGSAQNNDVTILEHNAKERKSKTGGIMRG